MQVRKASNLVLLLNSTNVNKLNFTTDKESKLSIETEELLERLESKIK